MNGLFRLGINYWPARTAMSWWQSFDPSEVAADFRRIASGGFDSVRLFLTWQDFQPSAARVDAQMVERLVTTLDVARQAGLVVMPTLFTGHMSGVNWIPEWAQGGSAGDDRFRVVSGGAVAPTRLRNWYTDRTVVSAQSALASELSRACAGHPALWAWDLGNENSNCAIPPDKVLARNWLARIIDAIRRYDGGARVTIGLHMEDLEQDRNLGPAEAAEVCDFLTMHGYPGYAAWARSPTDEQVLPFLARVTRWLGGGAEVLFSEFGVPTYRRRAGEEEPAHDGSAPSLVEEQAAAKYVERSLRALSACGCSGAMLWCYSDYVPELWQCPPLDVAVHERSFGLWRADTSPKPALADVQAFAKRRSAPKAQSPDSPKDSAWIDIEPGELFQPPGTQLPRLYRRYCEALG
jgi:endo-1,4-beta-mannosidase